MIRTIITPDTQMVSFNVPKEYVEKKWNLLLLQLMTRWN